MRLAKLIFWIFVALCGLIFIVFAIHNTGTVSVDLWPAPFVLLSPVYLLVFAALLIGFLVGAVVAWSAGGSTRRRARERQREARRLESELSETRRRLPAPNATAETG